MIIYDKNKFVKESMVSVNVLTYNQQELVKETLDSSIGGREWRTMTNIKG